MSRFLIHGWATTAQIWPAWLATNKDYGYQSSYYPDFSHLTKEFITHYEEQGKPLTLIGWSLGGMLSLQLAAAHPDKIKKLILFATTPRFTSKESYTAGLAPGIIKNLSRKLSKEKWQTQLDFYQLMFSSNEYSYWESFASQITPSLSQLETSVLQAGLSYLLETDLRYLLPSIELPCHILHGSNDTICPPEAALFLANSLPNAKLTLIPGAGHIPFYTQYEYCKDHLQY